MNDVKILGNITQTPELRKSANGIIYTFFTIATNYKDKATFIPVTAFNGLAEWICKYHKKGDKICISGYIDGGTKETDYKIKIIANEGYFATPAPKQNTDFNNTVTEFVPPFEKTEQLPFN